MKGYLHGEYEYNVVVLCNSSILHQAVLKKGKS